MTTHDVMVALVKAGWRGEVLAPGCAPVLTNQPYPVTPVAFRRCASCQRWMRLQRVNQRLCGAQRCRRLDRARQTRAR